MTADLENHYRAYLAALDERRLDTLHLYVHDELTYNGAPMTRQRYRDLIATDIDAIPDLTYDARLIVATADQVACRIEFVCTPRKDFLGFTPDGSRISFAEHVFYRFHGRRITAVTSLIDRHAIRRQLDGYGDA